MIQLIPLRGLLLIFFLLLFAILIVTAGPVVVGPIFLHFEFFLDVIEVVLIHVGKQIFGFLLLIARQF